MMYFSEDPGWRWLRDQDDDVLPEKMRPIEAPQPANC